MSLFLHAKTALQEPVFTDAIFPVYTFVHWPKFYSAAPRTSLDRFQF